MADLTYQVVDAPAPPFRTGETVHVHDRTGLALGAVQIIKVTAKKIVTDCGREWTRDGWWIGESQAWPFPTIRRV